MTTDWVNSGAIGQDARYESIERIGDGGTSTVYRAFDRLLGREVALKVIPPAERPDGEERFRREVLIGQRLNHPHIVRTFGLERLGDGSAAIVMEYVQGTSARTVLEAGTPVGIARLREMISAVAEALAYAHAQGVVHRDIKPSNILLSEDGVVKLSDFGSATLLEERGPAQSATMIGTPAFMSPEQLAGNKADARSDIFSLGLMIIALHEGSAVVPRPFGAPPAVPRGMPSWLKRIVERCVEPDPAERFKDGGELRTALERAGDGTRQPLRRILSGSAAAVALCTAVLALFCLISRETPFLRYHTARALTEIARLSGRDLPPDSFLVTLALGGAGEVFDVAIDHENLDLIDRFLPHDGNEIPETLLLQLTRTVCRAVEIDNREYLKRISDAGTELNGRCTVAPETTFPIDIAIERESDALIGLIAENGGIVYDQYGQLASSTFQRLVRSTNREVVRKVLHHIPKTDTPVWHGMIIQLLGTPGSLVLDEVLRSGVDLNGVADRFGEMPIHTLTARCMPSELRRLLDVPGADPNLRNRAGFTPIFLLCRDCPKCAEVAEVARLLAAHGADVNARDTVLNETVLAHLTTGGGKEQLHALLTLPRLDVDAANAVGNTALQVAVVRKNVPLVKLLLEHGASPDVVDIYEKSVRDYARESANDEITALLPAAAGRSRSTR